MTELLFRDDAYLKSCSATVVALHGDAVELDRTVFYPAGGGQPGDSGRIAGMRVTDARKGEDGESVIFFVCRENYPVEWVEGAQYPWGKAQVLREGKDVVLIGCGPLVGRTIDACHDRAVAGHGTDRS